MSRPFSEILGPRTIIYASSVRDPGAEPNCCHVLQGGSSHRSRVYVYSREMNVTELLPFFRLFPAVEALHLSGGVDAYIASVLEDTTDSESKEMVASIFPALNLIWLDADDNNYEDNDDAEDPDKPVGSIERFLSMHRLSGHPITVAHTREEFLEADLNPV